MQSTAKNFVRWVMHLLHLLTMKLKFTGHKLENPTVNYISLVDRGANRIPFRIVKQQKGEASMGIDLGRIFKQAKPKADDKPTVVGLCVQKGIKDEEIRAIIEKAGFKVDTVLEREDGTIIYAQTADVKPEECTLVKMQQGLVVLMKGFDPYAIMGEDMPFGDVVKAQGFIPSVSVAFEALQNTMAGILFSAPTGGGDDVLGKVDTALGDFHKYVLEQAKAIPPAAFKCEAEIAEVLKSYKPEAGSDAEGDDDADDKKKKKKPAMKEDDEDDEAKAADAEKPGEGSGEEEGQEGKEKPLTLEMVGDVAQKAVASAIAPIHESVRENVKIMKTLLSAMQEHSGKLKELASNQQAFASKIVDVEKVAKAAEDKMKGTVVGGAPAGDRQVAQKSDEESGDGDPRQGTFDTAFLPPQWRKEHIRKVQDESRRVRVGR